MSDTRPIFVTALARHAFAVADAARDRPAGTASKAELVDVARRASPARRSRPMSIATGAVAGAVLAQHPARAPDLRATAQQPHAPTVAKVEDVGACLQRSRHG
jgi:hypothetical protein